MTQTAVVTKILDGDMAEIEVQRQSACGHDCKSCGGCTGASAGRITVCAVNRIGAKPGDKVLVLGDTKQVLGSAALVYLFPLTLFFFFYAAGSVLFSTYLPFMQTYTPAVACIGFVVGMLCVILYNHRLKKNGDITYTIVKRS